jgi:hypothetical protein
VIDIVEIVDVIDIVEIADVIDIVGVIDNVDIVDTSVAVFTGRRRRAPCGSALRHRLRPTTAGRTTRVRRGRARPHDPLSHRRRWR